jgi:hypothetical protein
MSQFYFFTDPGLLDSQVAAQAFGPVGASTGNDQFRVTDLHTSSSTTVPAFAICDGLVCAQTDDQGTLTLILKPSVQPPFDFPAISYILYKGIDPLSLLSADGKIDTAQEADSDLISAIKTAWELEANGNTGSPTRECIGLQLNPTDYPAADNPARFADSQPLDKFFYEGDPKVQLPFVRGGGRLGKFSSSSPFGIEIVVERIGRRPKIALARKLENIVSVTTLATAADASAVFHHWAAKDAILDFIDPCAFWGSFFAAKLRAWNTANDEFEKLSGNEIYETVLRGTATGAAKFANRNRAYIDIRNEHGNSLNYYQADGPNIQLTLDAGVDIDTCEVNYYGSGWPNFAVDNSNLPTGTTGDKIDVRFALPKTTDTLPLIYISTGYRDAFRRLKDSGRFMDRPRRADVPYLEEASITIPLMDDGGGKIASSYQKICSFKRPLLVEGVPLPVTDPASLAPAYAGLFDNLFQVWRKEEFFLGNDSTIARTFAEERYVPGPTSKYGGFAARLTIAEDADNCYWIVTPYAYYLWPGVTGLFDGAVHAPAVVSNRGNHFLASYLARKTPYELREIMVTPPQGAMTQGPIAVAVEGHLRRSANQLAGRPFENTLLLSLKKSDVTAFFSDLATANPIPGSIFLLLQEAEFFEAENRRYSRSSLSASYLRTSPSLARETVSTTFEVFSDANI